MNKANVDPIEQELYLSGLTAQDIKARTVGPAELAAANIGYSSIDPIIGYVIPYYDIDGKPIPFYRVKIQNEGYEPKYKQPKDTPTHLYFPPNFSRAVKDLLRKKSSEHYVIITEGEKKAAAATKLGFPCVGLGGVDSWRNRTLILPGDTEFEQGLNGKIIRARIPKETDPQTQTSGLAKGLLELIDLCIEHRMSIFICFDTDEEGIKLPIQKAAARLGHELRFRGFTTQQIRQLILPAVKDTKIGLDDFLTSKSALALQNLIESNLAQRITFPRMPDVRAFVNKKLQRAKMSRKETQEVALVILLEMEACGMRMSTPATEAFHYFDNTSHTLLPVDVVGRNASPQHETAFGVFLYRRFGLSSNDKRIMEWLATLFTGEPGVIKTKTYKVITVTPDNPNEIAVQLGDSRFAVISGDPEKPLTIYNNGSRGILFEQGQVEKVNVTKLQEEFERQQREPLSCIWHQVIETMNFSTSKTNGSINESKILASLLFYISPWLNRWRSTQMPVELIIGEAGSGKSSLYGLRQQIMTGNVNLVNLSSDIRDWYSSISSVGGLHIVDNVHFTASAKDTKQRLSDEICRIITEPNPHVELRKLYTTASVIKLPVQATFAITAIEQPFRNTDFIQRAAIFELKSIGTGHDAEWSKRHSKKLSVEHPREGWLAHHFVFIHRFLAEVAIRWDSNYASSHRLANYEQALRIAAQLFRFDDAWIPAALTSATTGQVASADWTMQGLESYVKHIQDTYPLTYVNKRFTTKDITQWALVQDRYSTNGQLTNAWSLGKYFKTHAQLIQDATFLKECSPQNNRKTYRIIPHVNLEEEEF